ncbi:hypothetical protein [Reyranella sp.]|uniref:hypothetical protein n=1 Tax=Reyranella sp. TaxID=1929291 RepID=UPI003D0DA7E8
MSPTIAYRGTVLLLWGLAAWNAFTCRGLFWDGASFLANMLETQGFHDFYPARAHIAWLTQWPVLLLVRAGVRDTHLLAMVFSATLLAVPAALYHLSLARVRQKGALLAAVIAVIGTVYMPTGFFIVGEYNIAYAAVTAVFAIALTGDRTSWRDGAMLLALGLTCIASYEAMIYLGPLSAAVIAWSARRSREPFGRLLAVAAALAFLGATVVSGSTVVEYWNHEHFVEVRGRVWQFWQNLQFLVVLAGFALIAVVALVSPSWLAGRGPVVAALVTGAVLVSTPWFRQLVNPESMIFPPAHYLARSAAGGLLAVLLSAMWLHVAWPEARWRLLAMLHRPMVARRLATAMFVLVLAGAVPDVALSRYWSDYLAWFRGIVTTRTGLVYADELPMRQWPQRLFAQDWTYPALSVLVRSAPGQAIVVTRNDYKSNPPFDPSCGTVPALVGFRWR